MNVVAIVSGGMDSVTLAYHLADQGHGLHLLSFDYGQRHAKELACAEAAAKALHARWDRVDLTSITKLLTGSSLTDRSIEVPDGHYAEESMRSTVVPNRNMMMLSVAGAVAVAEGADAVATGVHAGDHFVYPDCRPEFVAAAEVALQRGNDGFARPGFALLAPFVHITKADIASLGDELGVDWANTWSCYKGGDEHCGTCGTCVERKEAFELANVVDPTPYER